MTTKPLSLAELQALSDDTLRIMVAEACGYVEKPDKWYFDRRAFYKDGTKYATQDLPEYVTSLDAIARAEETLTDEQHRAFRVTLQKIINPKMGGRLLMTTVEYRAWFSAPAKQRCLAFLAVMQNQ